MRDNQKLAELIGIQIGNMIAGTTSEIFAKCEENDFPLSKEQKAVVLGGFIQSVLSLPTRICATLDFSDLTNDLDNPPDEAAE
jgi:hypothetical protein